MLDQTSRYMPFSVMGGRGYLNTELLTQDTRRLKIEELGLITVVLKAMSLAGGSVPADDELLVAVVSQFHSGISLQEWRRMKLKILPLFLIQDGRLIQKPDRQYVVPEIPTIN